jgi:hypothetical protein
MVGPSGFRFVRIDNTDPERPVELSQVRAALQIRDLPYLGSFRCNDERLNRIWQVGAYTVHLNMQEYLWDGIKRDRLVWIGDMHPEVSTIHAVFGFSAVVPRSLDLTRDVTPVTEWMNGISSYSMWWVLIHEDLWLHQGDRDYLRADAAARGRRVVPDVNQSKSGAALLALAGMTDAKRTADTVLKVGGPKGVSTFYGFYVLQALARSGDTATALDFIRTYWGAMLDLGATTFWEDFNLAWIPNASRIDELVPPRKQDIHGDFGAYCYVGFRHSLCHGWASGPTARAW